MQYALMKNMREPLLNGFQDGDLWCEIFAKDGNIEPKYLKLFDTMEELQAYMREYHPNEQNWQVLQVKD